MSYGHSVRLLAEPLRSLAFGAIGAAYIGVGTSIDNPARMILVQNFTDETLMFSFDGVEDHFPLVESAHLILDIAGNRTSESGFYLAEGQRLYVKEILVTPTTGSVYLTVFYGKN